MISAYQVFYKLTNEFEADWKLATTIGGYATLEYEHSGLTSTIYDYQYRVRAQNAKGDG